MAVLNAECPVFRGIGSEFVQNQAQHDDGLAADRDARSVGGKAGGADNGEGFERLEHDALQ